MTLSSTMKLALILGVPAAIGCGARPLPLGAPAGSTISIPVGGELGDSTGRIGYGSDVLEEANRYDDQRGKLVFKLVSGSTEWPLHTRAISRLAPDPATQSAHENRGDEYYDVGISQVVALVDIPVDTPEGTYTMKIGRCRRTQDGGACDPLTGSITYNQPFTVTPGTGSPNPATELFVNLDTSEGLRRLYPYPKLVLDLGTPPPAAAHILLYYPKLKMGIKWVFEEQHEGRSSIVSWRDDPEAGTLTIDFVDPAASVAALAIAFEVADPFVRGRVLLGDTIVGPVQRYDADGVPLSGSVTLRQIR